MIVDYYEIKKQTCNYMCKRDKCPDQKIKPRKRRYPPRICGKIDRSQYFKRHGFPDPGEDDRYHGNQRENNDQCHFIQSIEGRGKNRDHQPHRSQHAQRDYFGICSGHRQARTAECGLCLH